MMKLSLVFISIFVLQGCSTTRGKPEPRLPLESKIPITEAPVVEPTPDEEPLTKYSDLGNMAPPSDRNYKRMTRQKMEEDSELYGSAGSLWKMEGQTSYLFAENKHRREGDPTSIKMEGPALKMIETKVAVVQDLLKQLDEQRIKAEEDAKKAEEEKVRLAQLQEEKKLKDEQIAKGEVVVDPFAGQYPPEPDRKPAAVAAAIPTVPAIEEKIDLKEIELIPSKIVEQLPDGIYRIRGQQFLTIKKKPYKVIATALIRAEDFSDSNISSSKLLDAQFDVLHVKRTTE